MDFVKTWTTSGLPMVIDDRVALPAILPELTYPLWKTSAACLFLSFLYVSSLYVWKGALNCNRDDPATIKRRIISVSVVSLISPMILWIFLPIISFNAVLLSMGLHFQLQVTLFAVVFSLSLVGLLFLGPLVQHALTDKFEELRMELLDYRDIKWWRNFIVGPITEEWVFRGCMVPLMLASGLSFTTIIFLTPTFFGFAHVHHIIQRIYLGNQGNQTIKLACIQTVFQFAYTCVFGWLSTFLFLSTGQLIAPIVAHSFCNLMGFPNFGEALSHPRKKSLCICYVAGLLGFALSTYSFTYPKLVK